MTPEEPVRGPLLTGPDGLPLVQEFPKMLYHAEGLRQIVASSDEQEALMATGGWSEVPVEAQPKEP